MISRNRDNWRPVLSRLVFRKNSSNHELNDKSQQSGMNLIKENYQCSRTNWTNSQVDKYWLRLGTIGFCCYCFVVAFSGRYFFLYMYIAKKISQKGKYKEIIILLFKNTQKHLAICLFQAVLYYIKVFSSFHKIGTIVNMCFCILILLLNTGTFFHTVILPKYEFWGWIIVHYVDMP